ncbi:hypothetical protein Zmor_013390 [Zophobas morio]|uniref:Uncharacterized protein n=1 Tax=Zophobas morio TaxID=2755281 RepID=A0AA38IFB5_9CUCU|nr:hypothetical protein Zmor_013390 [Zophobas morio]
MSCQRRKEAVFVYPTNVSKSIHQDKTNIIHNHWSTTKIEPNMHHFAKIARSVIHTVPKTCPLFLFTSFDFPYSSGHQDHSKTSLRRLITENCGKGVWAGEESLARGAHYHVVGATSGSSGMKYQHWRLANLLEVCDLLHTSDAPATSRPPYCFDVKQGTMWRRRRTSAAEWTFERFPPFVGKPNGRTTHPLSLCLDEKNPWATYVRGCPGRQKP